MPANLSTRYSEVRGIAAPSAAAGGISTRIIYRYAPDRSKFIVEVDEPTHQRAGFDQVTINRTPIFWASCHLT